jgi:serine protease Do
MSSAFESLAALSSALTSLVEHTGRSVFAVASRGPRAAASAAVWRPGLVVTVAHAWRRMPAALTLIGEGGAATEATLVGVDASTDLALFRLADERLPAITPSQQAPRAGAFVVAVGRAIDGELAASQGIVQRVGGAWQTWLGGTLDAAIRLDGGLHDGLSGAPVADASGGVIGIASTALSRSHGIVIPSSTVSRVVDGLLAKGHVPRAFLGIGIQPVEITAATAERAATHGLLVTSLSAGGPALQAGLMVGDIVTAVDGRPVESLAALRSALAGRVGEAVPVQVSRGGVATTISLTVGEWPNQSRRCG